MRLRFGRRTTGLILAGMIAIVLVGSFAAAVPTSTSAIHPATSPTAPMAGATATLAAAAVPSPAVSAVPGLSLSITANPRAVCAYGGTSCAVGTGVSRVTMTAQASPNGVEAWPAVQVAFVVETTAYDGVYDPSAGDPGYDVCAQGGGAVCDESNGVPFFVAHAQQIAGAIQAANPHSQVTFAMVDYFATLHRYDDGDGLEYHVDIPSFISADQFGSAVAGSFQANVLNGGYIYSDSDLSDNVLHSSVITALYGTIIGSGLDWSPNTHHVIVWMGSTTPRDPSFTVNYYPSSSDYSAYCQQPCTSSHCEPSYSFGAVTSPNCEGWVRSNNGNISDSIAGLARTAPECTDSIGKVCTIDVIDLYNGVTNPYSKQWVAGRTNGGPNSVLSWRDSTTILLAGCALAAATGGTWNGPNYFSCPDGQSGQLQEVPLGSPYTPNTANPTLLAAFRGIGFGPILTTLVANGTHEPIFQFAPYGSIQIAPAADGGPNWTSDCTLGNGVLWDGPHHCVAQPVQMNYTGVGASGGVYSTYGWNWSDNASTNQMYIGDVWSVSFNVIANGPPFSTVPVDACHQEPSCAIAGSQPIAGLFTWAAYLPITNLTTVVESFPVATLTVEVTPVGPPPVALPPPPPVVPPPIPLAIPPGIPVISPIGIAAQVGVANVALQAATAGFLGAGFIRVTQRNRPISMAVAALSGKNKNAQSMFEAGQKQSAGNSGIGRFE